MNILNKQTIAIAISSFLYCAAAQIGFGKPPADGGSHIARGIELAEQKHFDAAVAEFSKAIEESPKDPRRYANRGTAYRQGGRAAEAGNEGEGAENRETAWPTGLFKTNETGP